MKERYLPEIESQPINACPRGGVHHPNPPEIVNGQVVIRCGKCGAVVA